MKTSSLPTVLLALAALPIEFVAGQTPYSFDLDPGDSGFSWSGSTNQGALTGGSPAFDLHGTLGMELTADAQGIHAGRFTGADAAVQPDIAGEFSGDPSHPFGLTGARLTFASASFAIAPGGSFSTTLVPTFTGGEIMLSPPLGPASLAPLDGMVLAPVVVSGTLAQTGSLVRLTMPVTFTFDFALPAVTGSLVMPGTVAADLDCPDPVSYCVTSPNSVGPGAVVQTVGTPSVVGNTFVLQASGLPALQTGVFFYGASAVQAPFGNGVLCVGAPQFRLPVVTSTPTGVAAHALDVSTPPSQSGQILPGSTWHFQFWYRDPAAGGAAFNLSDGVQVFFCP